MALILIANDQMTPWTGDAFEHNQPIQMIRSYEELFMHVYKIRSMSRNEPVYLQPIRPRDQGVRASPLQNLEFVGSLCIYQPDGLYSIYWDRIPFEHRHAPKDRQQRYYLSYGGNYEDEPHQRYLWTGNITLVQISQLITYWRGAYSDTQKIEEPHGISLSDATFA